MAQLGFRNRSTSTFSSIKMTRRKNKVVKEFWGNRFCSHHSPLNFNPFKGSMVPNILPTLTLSETFLNDLRKSHDWSIQNMAPVITPLIINIYLHIYTVSQLKATPFYFGNNFVNFRPSLIKPGSDVAKGIPNISMDRFLVASINCGNCISRF